LSFAPGNLVNTIAKRERRDLKITFKFNPAAAAEVYLLEKEREETIYDDVLFSLLEEGRRK
jgi:hypothetical protein